MAKKNIVIKILLACAVAFVAVNALKAAYSPYVKQFATNGTYENTVEATVLLVRDETIVNPGINGVYESYASEGQRVNIGSSLGAVLSGDIDEEKMNELNRLNSQIEALNNSISEAGVLSIEDSKVESTLSLSVSNLRYAAAKNDVKSAVGLVEDIKILTQRKAGAMTSTSAQEELNALTARRDEITRSLGGTHQRIYAPTYGLYSNKLDGLENVLTYKNISNTNAKIVDSYFQMAESSMNATGVCKIINNYQWYILFTLTADECEGLKSGESYTVSFKDLSEKQLLGTVSYISEPDEDDRMAVIMKFDRHIENFTYSRITRVSICKEKYSGIYIPSSALRVHEGTLGVWVQNEISLAFRSVSIVFRSDDFVLARENAEGKNGFKNIVLYDNMVIDPDK